MRAESAIQRESAPVASNLEVLRQEILGRTLLLGVAVTIVAALLVEQEWQHAKSVSLGIGLSCMWGYGWRSTRRVAAIGFCVGAFLSLTMVVLAEQVVGAAVFYAPIIAMAALVLGAPYALLTAFAASLVVYTIDPSLTLARSNALQTHALLWLVAAISWLASSPIQTVLDWSWKNYQDAVEQKERLREQQGLLRRTNKSLDDAYRRLETINQELARVRAAALEARQRKAEFVVNVSHELRTPLNLILGFSQMMVRAPHTYGQPLPPAYREDVEAIYRNAEHLTALVDDILDLSQIEAGRMGLRKERVPVAEVVAEAIAAVAGLYEGKGLELRAELTPDLPEGYFDRTRVRQILINLLNNAVRFTDQGGVVIRATADERQLVLSVQDTGIGIQPEDLPHIWEEFRQFGPVERRLGGSGMGLPISRSFAELHGGNMWVESTPGQGTTFYVALPRTEQIDTVPLPSSWQTRLQVERKEPGLVVLLSDDPEIVHMFERHLDGYRVIAAPNERRAVRYARAARAHGIVVIGPDRETADRLELAVQQQAKGLPVVSCVLPTQEAESLSPAVVDFIPKPVSRERLAAALRRIDRKARNLMIVDDDPETARMIERLVRSVSRRYQVTSAIGGAEALAVLERSTPDAVLLDLVMPGIDGYRVLAALQSRGEGVAPGAGSGSIPVIVVSGHSARTSDVRVACIGITRGDGLTVRETMRCLQVALDAGATVPEVEQSPLEAPTG